jgi:hypothetical protein
MSERNSVFPKLIYQFIFPLASFTFHDIFVLILAILFAFSFASVFVFFLFSHRTKENLIVSEVPLSRDCLLNLHHVYRKQPAYYHLAIDKPNGDDENKDVCQEIKSRRQCVKTPGCGWLTDLKRCFYGTPIGPSNPLFVPDAENTDKKNITLQGWEFSTPFPFSK